MTKDEGCWLYFMQKMRQVWSKPLAVAQREAENRTKLPNETLLGHVFCTCFLYYFPGLYR